MSLYSVFGERILRSYFIFILDLKYFMTKYIILVKNYKRIWNFKILWE